MPPRKAGSPFTSVVKEAILRLHDAGTIPHRVGLHHPEHCRCASPILHNTSNFCIRHGATRTATISQLAVYTCTSWPLDG